MKNDSSFNTVYEKNKDINKSFPNFKLVDMFESANESTLSNLRH